MNLARQANGENKIPRPREMLTETFRVVVVAPESIFNGREGVVLCTRHFDGGESDLLVEVMGRDGTCRMGFAPHELHAIG